MLAAVLRIRDGAPAGAGLAAGPRPRRRALGAARRPARATTRTSSRRCGASSPRRSTCATSPTSSSSAVFSGPDRVPGRADDRHRVPRAGAARTPTRPCPTTPRWHPVADAAADRVRPRRDRRRGPASGCGPSSPTPTSASRWRPASSPSRRCASCTRPRSATRCRPPTCSGCSPGAALLEPTGAVAPPGPAGGRPAALFRFADRSLRVTDAFAVLRPPGESGTGSRTVADVAETLPLFPLGTVLMPGASLPLHIFEPRYRQLTVDLVTGAVPDRQFGVVAVREGWTPDDDGIARPARRRLHGRAARRAAAARRPVRHRHPRRAPVPAARPGRRVQAVPDGLGGVPARRRDAAAGRR